MSADVVKDIMDLMQDLGLGEVYKDIYSPQIQALRKNPYGILVEQRNTSPAPDVLLGTDTVFINVQVRGPGGGEEARRQAADRAMQVYRAMSLVMDRVINETHYIRIYPDSAPYEVEEDGNHDFLLGLEVVRYYEQEVTA